MMVNLLGVRDRRHFSLEGFPVCLVRSVLEGYVLLSMSILHPYQLDVMQRA